MDASDEVERAFAPIAESVQRFAETHSFHFKNCVQGNSGWELTRPHAAGGDVTLLLLYNPSLGLGIGSVWQFPCPEMSLLYSHFRPINACPVEPIAVAAALNSELQHLSQVKFGYWTHLRPLQAAPDDAA